MDDFWGVLLGVSIMFVIFFSMMFGNNIAKSSFEKDCMVFDKVSINDKVYQCKLIKESA